MTYLQGEWRIYNGNHRLFDLFADLFVITASIAKAFNLTAGASVTYAIGDHANFECAQFDLEARLPLVGPIELVLQNLKPNSIAIGFEKNTIQSDASTPAQGASISTVLTHVISPIFTSFYEDHVPWFLANVEGDKSKWPSPWGFGRLIRNAMSHGGALNIDNPNAPIIAWYGLSYGPNDNGKRVIGTDLSFADLLILMIEMSDDLDKRSCPFPLP